MSYQISDEIIRVIDHLCQKFGVIIDWANDDIVPILRELAAKYIRYEIITSIVWLIVGAVVFVICGIIFGYLLRHEFKIYGFIEGFSMTLVLFILISVVPVTMIISQIVDIIRCNTFPELQIIQYIQSFM